MAKMNFQNKQPPVRSFLIAGLIGLLTALGIQPILASYRQNNNIFVTKDNLRKVRTAILLYMEGNDDLVGFESRMPTISTLMNDLVPLKLLQSPCLENSLRSTVYWTGMKSNSDAILVSNIACSSPDSLRDNLSKKRGLGVTRSGTLLDISAFGNPEVPEWWTDPNTRL